MAILRLRSNLAQAEGRPADSNEYMRMVNNLDPEHSHDKKSLDMDNLVEQTIKFVAGFLLPGIIIYAYVLYFLEIINAPIS